MRDEGKVTPNRDFERGDVRRYGAVPTAPPPQTKFYTKEGIDRCVGAAYDVLLGPPNATTQQYQDGVKDALRLFQTALALMA